LAEQVLVDIAESAFFMHYFFLPLSFTKQGCGNSIALEQMR